MDELRQSLEKGDLSEIEKRIELLASADEAPTALSLGVRLAVAMAAEMRDGVPVGSRSGAMVAGWAKEWPQTAEDAVAVARKLLLEPGKLKEALGERLFGKNPGEEAR
ncbi:MAG: hypothetical protein J6Z50_01175 [Fibrobacterales bacterium]|nr:hypothetical protein [Fibrobacterales bacterium]MBP5187718.1 hypothetical protein [Fibrobacterales bacterium]